MVLYLENNSNVFYLKKTSKVLMSTEVLNTFFVKRRLNKEGLKDLTYVKEIKKKFFLTRKVDRTFKDLRT